MFHFNFILKKKPLLTLQPPKKIHLSKFSHVQKNWGGKKPTHFAKILVPKKLVFLSRMDSCQNITVSCPSHENRAMARVQCLKAAMVPHDLATCSQQIPWGGGRTWDLPRFCKEKNCICSRLLVKRDDMVLFET